MVRRPSVVTRQDYAQVSGDGYNAFYGRLGATAGAYTR
jgi:hypothetical protein